AKAFWVLMARLAGWEPEITAADNARRAAFVLSPDPADNEIRLLLPSTSRNTDIEITLIDTYGGSLRSFQDVSPDSSGTITLPLDGVAPGICFLAVRMGQSRFVQRFIKA